MTLYFILGPDSSEKFQKIDELRNKILPAGDARNFDYDVLHATKLDSETLKKSLLDLPAMAKQRLLVLHDGHKLSAQNKDILIEFFSSKPDHVVLIIVAESFRGNDAFFKKAKPLANVTQVGGTEKELNVFDATRELSRRQPAAALKVLSSMMDNGAHPLQIIPGLVWFWGKQKARVSAERFAKGLEALQEADLNIKRSRLPAQHALQVLVVKLSILI